MRRTAVADWLSRPAPRPNLPDSSDESEGGVLEAFRKRRAREDQLGNVEAKAGVATAHPMTVGPPAVLPGSPATVESVGFDPGIAVGESVGFNQGIAVGESVGFDQGIAVGESVGFDLGEEEKNDGE